MTFGYYHKAVSYAIKNVYAMDSACTATDILLVTVIEPAGTLHTMNILQL